MGSGNTGGFGQFAFVEHPGTGSAPGWDFAAKFSTGTWLIQGQDDVEPPEKWDSLILQAQILAGLPDEVPTFIAVGDGFRKDALCCTAIMNRARYKQAGEFLHAGFLSVFSDDDVTYRSLRDARDGKCIVLNCHSILFPHMTFTHRHHYHDRSVAWDETYARENSSEAYRIGAALFAQRNPEAATDGLKTW